MIVVSDLAARIRPGAVIALTAIVVIAVFIQLAVKAETLPLWKQVAAVIVGPSAAFAGGVMSPRRVSPQKMQSR